MSTKKLQRTVIEGGRNGGNKWERRNSHRIERASQREFLDKATQDPERADDLDITGKPKVYKEFKDKLSPMYRWLHSQVGRIWDDVKSEVLQKFDTRTTAGRHITYDHLLSSVAEFENLDYRDKYYTVPDDPNVSYSQNHFYVDDNGILCRKRYLSYKKEKLPKIPAFNTNQIVNWLNGRMVGKVGNKFFWFVPVGKNKKHKGWGGNITWRIQWGPPKNQLYYRNYVFHFEQLVEEISYKRDFLGKLILSDNKPIEVSRTQVWKNGQPSFRQGRKLDSKEMEFWNTLPEFYQTKIIEESPNHPNSLQKDYYGFLHYR